MTNNYFLSCSVCETSINLRAQIGFYNIPFNIHCPKCNTHIYGKIIINQETLGIKLDIENAHFETTKSKVMNNQYCAELSAEFPTSKMYHRDFEKHDLPPFIRNTVFYEDGKVALEATKSAMKFSSQFDISWKRIKVLYDLLWNEQGQILYPKLEKELRDFEYIPIMKIDNDLDANMALHQMFITTTGISAALKPDTISKYMNVSELIFDNTFFTKVRNYIQENHLHYNDIEKKAFKLIDSFASIYEQLIPVVALRNKNCLDNVNRESYGIMTTNFEKLSSFYAQSYEWILDNVDTIVALNNISIRNDYNTCINGKSYDELIKKVSKYKKLEYIDETEPFSPPTGNLKNRIRNAIQHVDAEIDYTSQQISFKDTHRGKTNEVSMYLIDFADLCIENFSIIIYILELIYNLKKGAHIINGFVPSVYLESRSHIKMRSIKKVGRNDPCPCGTGKKYKHCCL